jgi:DNA polymerase III subunit alpha
MQPSFVHLHLHSEYSLVDSTVRIPALVKRCAQLGLPAVAVTDQSNLFALVKFFAAAQKAGIKPVAGSDLWVAAPEGGRHRITLLCRDREGFLSLSRLLSRAYLEGHQTDGVAVQPEWLAECSAGLSLIAGRESQIGQRLGEGRLEDALTALDGLRGGFGDEVYLELTRCGRSGEEDYFEAAVELAGLTGTPVLASNDVRFLASEDFEAHEARVCIASGRVLADPRRPRDYSAEQYLKSPEEMQALFADLPVALANTVELAKRCNLELRLGTYYLPAFPVPAEHTLDSWIHSQAADGLEQRLAANPLAPGKTRENYDQRLERELDVINRMGFPGYFLIVADFIGYAKAKGIPVGPGRGSGAGSLVAWSLGITDLDPLRYDLLFERFLNPERVSMPDFDIDFCMDRRDEVIRYVADKYGHDRVSQIITYGTMAAKAVVRDCGRVLGLPFPVVDGIAKLIPNTLGISLEDALGRSEASRKNSELIAAELVQRYQSEDEVRELVDLALKLEDLTRNAGKHAGGVVIAPSPLSDFSPLFAEHDEGARGKNPVTQFDKDDVEAVGLVKFDFLGLRTLTIIDWAMAAINRRRAREGQAPLDLARLPLDDVETYRLFARGDTVAVFQFESPGMRKLLKQAMPDRFEDLIALVSLFRPGPMDLIPDFIERKHGRQAVEYLDPRLTPILGPTYGIMVYQEQVMQIAQDLGGYSLGGADLLRRAMGKKKPEEMAKQREIFRAGAQSNGIAQNVADAVFDQMEKFAGYGFNKSHAAAYALVAYQTAWLKCHYPAEFMAATCTSDMDNTDKVVGFLAETRALKIAVQPPDVNASDYVFVATAPREVRYGLGAVKGVGHGACEDIVRARESGGAFRDLLDFCTRVGNARLNRRALEALVLAGALDGLGSNRASLMHALPEVLRATEQVAREREAGQASLFGGGGPEPGIQLSPETVPEWPLERRLLGERETLGGYLSGHPVDPHRLELNELVGFDLGQIERIHAERKDRRGEAQVVVAGMVVTQRKQRGDTMATVLVEDGAGKLECTFYPNEYAQYGALISRDRLLLIEGSLIDDRFSGGYLLKVRRCWDWRSVCSAQARRLNLMADLREAEAFTALQACLDEYRPGSTPLRLSLTTSAGSGVLDLNGRFGVRAEPELLGALRALPGVREVSLSLTKPWVN